MKQYKNRIKTWVIKEVAFRVLSWIWKMSHFQIQWPDELNCKNLNELRAQLDGPLIIVFWHEEILLALHLLLNKCSFPLNAVISKSRDGKALTSITKKFSHLNVIEVAHDGRSDAFQEIVQCLQKNETVVITPDGPRGPWKEVKKGVALAAKKSGATILAFSSRCSGAWKLPTSDGLQLPKPGAKIRVKMQLINTKRRDNGKSIVSSIQKTLNEKR